MLVSKASGDQGKKKKKEENKVTQKRISKVLLDFQFRLKP